MRTEETFFKFTLMGGMMELWAAWVFKTTMTAVGSFSFFGITSEPAFKLKLRNRNNAYRHEKTFAPSRFTVRADDTRRL